MTNKGSNNSSARRPRILVLGNIKEPLMRHGAEVRTVPATDLRAVLRGLADADGLLLCGGGDVSPSLYGARKHKNVYGISAARDSAELIAITAARTLAMPTFGICRGSQMLNVATGGTLHQHIPDIGKYGHSHGQHAVRSTKGSTLRYAFEGQWTKRVVTLHHQAVAVLGRGFVATGFAPDGTIEAIETEHDDEWWATGVQFHPEMASSLRPMQRLFAEFVAQARAAMPKVAQKKATHKRVPHTMPERTAARRATYAATKAGPITTRSRCFRCTIDFDERADYVDHMYLLHGVTLEDAR